MCWSGEASAALALLGFSTTAYLIKKKDARQLWLPLLYFTSMELLQAVTYIYIDECHLLTNKFLTLCGYLHITFQPFFINMGAMYFIPRRVSNIIYPYVYGICGIAVIFFLAKLYPFSWTTLCAVGQEPICGPIACSSHGNWHIAWALPLNNLLTETVIFPYFGLHAWTYNLVSFVMPILYGSWRLILVTFLLGPFLSYLLTNNSNEFPAVWCLFSIALCLTVVKSPIRKHLHTKSWLFNKHKESANIEGPVASQE